jgi:hypothetical protein
VDRRKAVEGLEAVEEVEAMDEEKVNILEKHHHQGLLIIYSLELGQEIQIG